MASSPPKDNGERNEEVDSGDLPKQGKEGKCSSTSDEDADLEREKTNLIKEHKHLKKEKKRKELEKLKTSNAALRTEIEMIENTKAGRNEQYLGFTSSSSDEDKRLEREKASLMMEHKRLLKEKRRREKRQELEKLKASNASLRAEAVCMSLAAEGTVSPLQSHRAEVGRMKSLEQCGSAVDEEGNTRDKYSVVITGVSDGSVKDSAITGARDCTFNFGDSNSRKVIQERTLSRIQTWTEDMVRTASLVQVMEKVKSGATWITIKGSPGEGKTTVAYQILKEFHKSGKEVFEVISPEEFTGVSNSTQSVIMLDDVLGCLEFDQAAWSRWEPVLHHILSEKEHSSHVQRNKNKTKTNTIVILVGRDYVLSPASSNLGKLSDFVMQDDYVVTVPHNNERTVEEKLDIWTAVSKSSGVELDDDTVEHICHITCPHGFPHVCRLFVTLKKDGLSTTAEEFFKTPLEFLNQSVEKFMGDRQKIILFKNMIRRDGRVSGRELGKLDSDYKIIQTARALTGTYLKKEDDYFLFDHPSVYDSVAYHLCEFDPLFVIDNCNLSFIHQRLRLHPPYNTQRNSSRTELGLVVYIPRSYVEDLASRFAAEISNRNLLQVLSHTAFRDAIFIKEVMLQLTLPLIELMKLADRAHAKSSFLSLIASNKSPELLKYIDNHKDIELTQSDINTVLYGVCRYAAIEVLSYLTQSPRHTLDINVKFEDERTPLMMAAETRDSQFVLQIMSLQPDLNVRDRYGKCPFHYMCENGLTSPIKQMIDMGAEIGIKDSFGLSALWYACDGNHMEVARLLLDRGAETDVRVIEAACEEGYLQILKVLFEQGVSVDMQTRHGTLLHTASTGGHLKVITYLMEKGLSVNSCGLNGTTPLHVACYYKRPEAVQCLLSHDAITNTRDWLGETPLHRAVERGSKECVEVLVKGGADVNVLSKNGETPLHNAVYSQFAGGVPFLPDVSLCQTLISMNININKQNKEGNTPTAFTVQCSK